MDLPPFTTFVTLETWTTRSCKDTASLMVRLGPEMQTAICNWHRNLQQGHGSLCRLCNRYYARWDARHAQEALPAAPGQGSI